MRVNAIIVSWVFAGLAGLVSFGIVYASGWAWWSFGVVALFVLAYSCGWIDGYVCAVRGRP